MADCRRSAGGDRTGLHGSIHLHSTRSNGRSLGELVREEMDSIPGTIALFGAFLIMIIILAMLSLIVVKALAESPWGMFTVMATLPIAVFMGVYMMRYQRPARIGEISVIGVVLLLHRAANHLDADWLRFRCSSAAGLADSESPQVS